MLFFSICDEKITKSSREKNRFRTGASPGACERSAVLNWRSSSIHASSYYYYYFREGKGMRCFGSVCLCESCFSCP